MPSVDEEVNKVTSDKTQDEDWSAIIEICHQITVSHGNTPQNYLNAIMKRLRNPNPNVAMKAITLLDACYSNCGNKFHRFLAKREFTDELRRLLGHVSQLHDRVRERLRGLLQNWANENENDQEMSLLCVAYQMLKREGVKFPEGEEAVGGPTKPPKTAEETAKKQLEEDVKKAIAASLKGEQKSGGGASSSMYPAMEGLSVATKTASEPKKKLKKYEALFNFEAGEDNELSFKSGDVIEILDNSDDNWWKGQLRGKVGLFPKNFVAKHVSGQSQAKKERAKEKKEKETREKKVELSEEKLDLTLEMLKKADAHEESSVEDPTLKDLEKQCEVMKPMIKQKIDFYQSKYDTLMDLNVQFRDAMAFYQKLLKDSSDAYRQSQVAQPPTQPFPQYPPTYPPPLLAQDPKSLLPDFTNPYPSYPLAVQGQGAYPPSVPQVQGPYPPVPQVQPGSYPPAPLPPQATYLPVASLQPNSYPPAPQAQPVAYAPVAQGVPAGYGQQNPPFQTGPPGVYLPSLGGTATATSGAASVHALNVLTT